MKPGFIKFLIKSRIPGIQLVILSLVYLISGLAIFEFDSLFLRIGSIIPFQYRIITVAVLTIFEFEVFQIAARASLVKSDRDFMASSGVRASSLSLSFSLYSLILMSLPSLLIFSIVSFISTASVSPYATVLFSIFIIASSVSGFLLRLFGRIRYTHILLILVAALGFLGLTGFPLAISNISGKYWQFSLIGAFAILAVAFAMDWFLILSRDDASLRFTTIRVKNTVKRPIDFSSWSGNNPLLRFSTTVIFAATRGNTGSRRAALGKITMAGMMFASSVIFLSLILFTVYFPAIGSLISVTVMVYYIFLISFLLFYSIINERIWIGWNTVEPRVAVRSYVSGRLFLLVCASTPVFAYMIYAYFSRLLILPSESFAIAASIPLLLFFPFFVYATIINLNVIRIQSRTFGGSMSEGTVFIFIPLGIAYAALSITGAVLIHFGIATVIFAYGLMVWLLLSRRIMEKSFFNLVKHGFI